MRIHPWKILAIVGPLVILAAFGFGLTRDPSTIQSATVGKAAPNFDLPALQGDGRVRLGEYKGRIVVLNFWASWCVSCRIEHDVLIQLGHTFAGRSDLAMLGINYRDTADAAQSYLERYGAYPYPSGVDPRGRTGIDFGVYGLPETYFLDANGRIHARHIGPIDRAAAHAILREMGIAP